MDLIKIHIDSVYDPDTFRGSIVGSGRFDKILSNAAFRVSGVNAPERRGTALEMMLEQKGRERLNELLSTARLIQIDLDGDMSFGRFHTDLIIDGQSWAQIMIEEKLAVEYNGEYSVRDFDWDSFVKQYHKDLL